MENLENKYGCIYMLTNLINGKIYIGQSTKINAVIERRYKGRGNIIKLAIKKYGWDNIKSEILDYASDQNELNDKEPYYIKECNSLVPIGYNLKKGGSQGGPGNILSSETRKKISIAISGENNPMFGKNRPQYVKDALSKAHKGKILTNEQKIKISKTAKKYLEVKENHWLYNKNHSEETKKKMSEAQSGYKNHKFGKNGIYKHSEETMNILKQRKRENHNV